MKIRKILNHWSKKWNMNWYKFLFSEQRPFRLGRHLIFWFLWWIYFTASYYHYEQSGLQKIKFEPWNFPFFIRSVLLLAIQVGACYYFINYLTPKFLLTRKLVLLALHTIVLSILILLSSYLIHLVLMPFVNTLFDYQKGIVNQNIWWTSITSGLLSTPKVICAAAAVTLLKRWWLKQKEKERLEKEKLLTNLRLLKAQMHPEFLFSSLHHIKLLTQNRNIEKASQSLLKLADILSYMLYESDKDLVPLHQEIEGIKCYLALEKLKMGNQFELDISVKGDTSSKMIVPLILVPFVENTFTYFGNNKREKDWLNIQLIVEGNELTMKLIHGKTTGAFTALPNEDIIARAIERLAILYEGKYEFKNSTESEIMMTIIKLELYELENRMEHDLFISEHLNYATT
ncbi:MAG: sensor histidine kinase [Flavisolibacter sp.]